MTPDDMGACLLTVIAVLLIYRAHPSVTPRHPPGSSILFLLDPTLRWSPTDPRSPPNPRRICLIFLDSHSTATLFLFSGDVTPLTLRCTSGRGSSDDDDKTQGTTKDAHAIFLLCCRGRVIGYWSSALAWRTTHLTLGLIV